MSEIVAALAVSALVALDAWLLGSPLLRFAGVLLVLAGLVATVLGNLAGLGAVAIGAVLWLAGQWLYGLRHHACASPLARRLFQHTPLRHLDPTRPGAGASRSRTSANASRDTASDSQPPVALRLGSGERRPASGEQGGIARVWSPG